MAGLVVFGWIWKDRMCDGYSVMMNTSVGWYGEEGDRMSLPRRDSSAALYCFDQVRLTRWGTEKDRAYVKSSSSLVSIPPCSRSKRLA